MDRLVSFIVQDLSYMLEKKKKCDKILTLGEFNAKISISLLALVFKNA